jgi:diguanylate cyclase (GGDEF)-like protein
MSDDATPQTNPGSGPGPQGPGSQPPSPAPGPQAPSQGPGQPPDQQAPGPQGPGQPPGPQGPSPQAPGQPPGPQGPSPQAKSVPAQGSESTGIKAAGSAEATEPGQVAGQVTEPEQATVAEGATGQDNRRRGMWAAAAVVCVLAGSAASVLGAHAIAHRDAAKSETSFQHGSQAIASTLKLAVQRQEELTVAASTFFAGNPKASAAEFVRWVTWARTRRRYPELDALGLLPAPPKPAPVHKPTTATASSTGTSAITSPTGTTATSTGASSASVDGSPTSVNTSPTSVAGEAPTPASASPAPAPVHIAPALLLSRDTGLSIYHPISAGHRQALAITTPVYRGNVTPHTVFGRTAASVGWLREVLVPGALLGQVLVGHPGYALSVTYRPHAANRAGSSLVFTSGVPRSDAQNTTLNLHDGWTVTSFGPSVGANVLDNVDALALLIGGILCSIVLGLLVDLLGAARSSSPATAPTEDEARVGAEAEAGAAAQDGALSGRRLYEPVTGLPNRELTLDRAERMVARAGRDSGMLAGALFVDIDQLKEVNEKLGLSAGNQLLKIVGQRLEEVVRAGDTVGRLDGDEFVVLVESKARGVRLDSLAQRMIEALHKPVEIDSFGPSFVLTASIGVAFGRYATPEDLLRDAHMALVSAKTAGKDRYTLFNANMRSVIEGRAVLEAELSTALAEDQFFLLYEPIYDLRTRRVAGLQALIRWQHPAQGVLEPKDFIPLAEETGLIVPIGRFVLEAACGRVAAWNVAGHGVGVSVKVSTHQLDREAFVTDVQRALQQSGIEPSLLTLEIPETAVISDLAAAAERLRELGALGVSIAIDDFGGSGYAHQADLRQLPLNSLRVDRSSLAASEDESYRSWLLEAILLVGRDLELTVVATGIETQEQMAALQTLGCTMAQGALLGAPSPEEDVVGLFAVELPTVAGVVDPSMPRDLAV